MPHFFASVILPLDGQTSVDDLLSPYNIENAKLGKGKLEAYRIINCVLCKHTDFIPFALVTPADRWRCEDELYKNGVTYPDDEPVMDEWVKKVEWYYARFAKNIVAHCWLNI